ncbi:ABC transporter permease [Spirulina subsalsa FACHB-351]|uniref:ABC transporter permease n=1 Tax=Spirulina subsalsa FACHB-351 TaxID=234711 RepID=A0ABT3L704_9CYAN|nr:ABC transporter permease [Spirulina subsalsa]MCW6037286.1 ABC transporter permease [Spirulina subsalsa FACHB-351]
MNGGRVWAIAANGFREVIRDRILYLLGLFGLLLVAAVSFLPEVSALTEDKIFLDFGLGMIGLLTSVVAIFVGTSLISKEIEKHTVLVMIPKPVSPAEFIVGKHLGLWMVLAVLLLSMTGIYLGLLVTSNILFPLSSIALSLLYLWLELGVLVATALMFGAFTSSLLAVLLSLAVYVMGHLSPDLVALGKLSKNPTIEAVTQNLYLVLPDLSRLNFRNEAVYGLVPEVPELLGSGAYALVYMIALLTLAILIFSRRQF